MQIKSFNFEPDFKDNISTKVILESSFSKEIRILMKEGQVMKEHKSRFPIIIQVLSGKIDLGIEGIIHPMASGEIIALEGNVLHDLTALKNTIIRLTLSKSDEVKRLQQVIIKSSK